MIELKEFKPKGEGRIYGVRSGGFVAYVYLQNDAEKYDWMDPFLVEAFSGSNPIGNVMSFRSIAEAKEQARSSVRVAATLRRRRR